ncbi:glycosyltransferase family 2 protein [Frisingicoccus sp.]|uniref:glycosyltransferase family 2 protein n=1 Tax=Frisingicoccus sp. TaxID=1918627 RepID=UPI003AB55196
MPKVSLCVPCYNEEENIYKVYEKLTEIMATMPQYDYEIIFEDNDSKDHTQDLLRELAGKDTKVKVILNTRNFGPARSGKNCCFNASGDVIISIASDLQTPPEMIPVFLKYWEQGYKIVMGQKEKSEEGRLKVYLRSVYYKIIKHFSEIPQYEHMTGFGAIDVSVYQQIKDMGEYEMSIRHIIAELGYEVKLVPYTQRERKHGKSSYNLWRNFDFAISSLIYTSKTPIRLMTIIGCMLSFFILILWAVSVVWKIFRCSSPLKEKTNGSFGLAFFASLQLFFTGILGEYLSVVLTKVSNRPVVVEKERINF